MHASTATPHAKISAPGRSAHARKQLPHWNHMSCRIGLGSTWHVCMHTHRQNCTQTFFHHACMHGEQFSAQAAPVSKPSSIASRIIWSKSYVVSRMWYGVAKSTPQLDKKCTVMTIIYWVMVHAFMHACMQKRGMSQAKHDIRCHRHDLG